MSYPKGKELVRIFLDGIKQYPEFKVLSDLNPLRIEFNGRAFMLFFKCITYAGNPYPINTTRAQLPYREDFNTLLDSEVFLFLGYDTVNDLYVCWEPNKTRTRLNQKSYVSFFCRQSLQDSVTSGEIKSGRLTNGDAYVLFKRSDISSFFEMLDLNFPGIKQNEKPSQILTIPISATEPIEGFLDDLETDSSVQLTVDQLIAEGRSKLSIVSECMNTFGSYYYKMRFIDWAKVVERYLDTTLDPDLHD